MAKSVTIEGISFSSKKAAFEHCQGLVQRWASRRQQRNRRSFAQREVAITGEDREFVEGLFQRHPEHGAKLVEAHVRGFNGEFCVARNVYGKPCLCLLTRGRPLVQFSYRRAIRAPEVGPAGAENDGYDRDRRARPARSCEPATSLS